MLVYRNHVLLIVYYYKLILILDQDFYEELMNKVLYFENYFDILIYI
jgi:hypothetical protein